MDGLRHDTKGGQTSWWYRDRFIAISAPSVTYSGMIMITVVPDSELAEMLTVYVKPIDENRFIEMFASMERRPI